MEKIVSEGVVKLALECGATLAGISNIEDLKKAPAYTVEPKMPEYNGVGTYMPREKDRFLSKVVWTEGIKSVIVLAYHHPIDDPKMDYWFEGHNTIGNRKLIGISKKLESIMAEEGVETYLFNYNVEKGGIFLKDSAVIAGMGCIGKNNLLITPGYGPYIRLRAIGLSLDLPSTGRLDYNPCLECEVKCWEKCTQGAFGKKIYSEEKFGRSELPGRIGNYNRALCNIQIEDDESNIEPMEIPAISAEGPVNAIKYCRICEYACPICR